jgi:ubiquinone/menaquinone biosynthesis C-methylase UbiE
MVEYLKNVNKGNIDYYKRLVEWIDTKIDSDDYTEINLLDLGCGCCEIGDCFKEHKRYNVTFADFEKYREDVIKCDMSKQLPFKDKSFDIIICWNVVEHVTSFEWINECYRILDEGGILIVLCPDWEKGYRYFYDTLTHYTPYTLRRMNELVKRTDFSIVELRHFANIPYLWRYVNYAFEHNLPFKRRRSILGVFKK